MINPIYEISGPAHRAAQGIRVAAEELGRAVKDEIGAEQQRTLVDGGGESVVNRQQRTMSARCRGEVGQYRRS